MRWATSRADRPPSTGWRGYARLAPPLSRNETLLCVRARHHLPEQAHDHQQYAATDTAPGDLTDDRAEIGPASGCCGTESRYQDAEQLAAEDAPHHARDRVAYRPQIVLLEDVPGEVAADRTADELLWR